MTMDREKLDKAAKKCATEMWSGEPKGEYIVDLVDYDNIIDAFKQGAEWLQSQPISNRLTEEESIRIKAYYEQHKNLEHYGKTCADRKAGLRLKIMFEQIFGKEMFEK